MLVSAAVFMCCLGILASATHAVTTNDFSELEALSRKFDLGQNNDVTRSPFAREFLKTVGL